MGVNGRPIKYTKDVLQKMEDFFDVEPYEEKVIQKVINGVKVSITEEVSNKLPTFERFAVNIGVDRDTLKEWRAKSEQYEKLSIEKPSEMSNEDYEKELKRLEIYSGFSATYKKCKDFQKDILIQNGLKSYYHPTFTIFCAKNVTDMRDRYENTNRNQEIGPEDIVIE